MSRVNPQKEGVLGECQDQEAYCCSYRITRSGGPNPAWFRLVLSQVGGIGNRLIKLDLKLSNHSVLDCLRAKSFNHHFCFRIKPGHHDTIRKFTILDLDGHYVLYRFERGLTDYGCMHLGDACSAAHRVLERNNQYQRGAAFW